MIVSAHIYLPKMTCLVRRCGSDPQYLDLLDGNVFLHEDELRLLLDAYQTMCREEEAQRAA